MTSAHVDGERASDEQIGSWVIQWSAVGLRTDLTHKEAAVSKPIMDMAYALSFERGHTRRLEAALSEVYKVLDISAEPTGMVLEIVDILKKVMRLS